MKFISKYTIRPEHRNDAIKRFLEGKAQPPEGVKLIGRWHSPNDRTGYSLVEADDAVAMGKYSHQWSDLLTMETAIVIDDQEFLQVIG
ncbi:MAG: DUF3303 family protein [Myxococcales bacterium]|jgi:hypothetical protein